MGQRWQGFFGASSGTSVAQPTNIKPSTPLANRERHDGNDGISQSQSRHVSRLTRWNDGVFHAHNMEQMGEMAQNGIEQ